jgi:phage terminase large subunit GpA-like protein
VRIQRGSDGTPVGGDDLGDLAITRVVFMKSSQVGATECALNSIGYTIAERPVPMLVLLPTADALKLWSTTKLEPMIRDTPALRSRVFDSAVAGRVADDHPQDVSGWLAARRLGQVERTASEPLRTVCDRRRGGRARRGRKNHQGDPLEQLERALRSHLRSGGKLLVISTPTVAGASRIAAEYERSDQRHYFVPCPDCGHMQVLRWRDEEGRYLLVCDRDGDGNPIPSTAKYACQGCGVLIDERHKADMLARGEWRATYPDRPVRGYHIWTAYSPFVSWAQIV